LASDSNIWRASASLPDSFTASACSYCSSGIQTLRSGSFCNAPSYWARHWAITFTASATRFWARIRLASRIKASGATGLFFRGSDWKRFSSLIAPFVSFSSARHRARSNTAVGICGLLPYCCSTFS